MNGETWLHAAATLPAPFFVLIVAALIIFSVAGFPIPITVTMLLAGALAVQRPGGWALFAVLVVVVALANTLRDSVTLLLGRGGGALWQRFARRATDRNGHHRQMADMPVYSTTEHDARTKAAALTVRNAHITAPFRRRWLNRQRVMQITHGAVLEAAERAMHGEEWVVLSLTRLSVLASPFDLAVGALRMRWRTFLPPIFAGRVLHALVLLGTGAISGAAWRHGTNIPTISGLVSLVSIVVLVVPTVVNRRIVRSRPPVATGLAMHLAEERDRAVRGAATAPVATPDSPRPR